MEAVVREVLLEVCVPQEAHHGFGWSEGEHKICFYEDYGQIVGHNPIFVQTTLTEMMNMLNKVGPHTNLGNTKAMVCTPGLIWGQQIAAA